jgi:splicing suppressor protein 51
MLAIRTNALHPAPQGIDRLRETAVNTPTVRIFILGARGESSLPRYFWEQLCYCFWRVPFLIYMIGPEAKILDEAFRPRADIDPLYSDKEDTRRVVWRENPHRKMTIETYQEKFQVLHDEELFQPFDPYTDVFFLFSPFFHHEELSKEWTPVIPQLLKTKCSIFVTDSKETLMKKSMDWVTERFGGEMDEILEAGLNEFRSLKTEVDLFDLDSFHQKNMYIWGFRGKRYQVQDNWALL